jgi:hypothetical protein
VRLVGSHVRRLGPSPGLDHEQAQVVIQLDVSGARAVELLLRDGRLVGVGTDEPEALTAALERALGEPAPLTAAERHTFAKKRGRWMLVVVLLGLVPIVAIGPAIYLMSRPVHAWGRHGRLEVRSFLYGDQYDLSRVASVELVSSLPARGVRTNGLALGPTLRGWFRLDGLGSGKLLLQADCPPFVLVRLDHGFVLVNFDDPARTRALYDALVAATDKAR